MREMKYQESQLRKFAHPPKEYEVAQIKATETAIRFALSKYFQKTGLALGQNSYEVFLQGSYKNKTNIARGSDVDLVVAYKEQFAYDIGQLTEAERKAFKERYGAPKVKLKAFKGYVHRALVGEFGEQQVDLQNKCIKLRAHKGYCEADIVPVVTHRTYYCFQPQAADGYKEGIELEAADGSLVRNYPKQHGKLVKAKSGATHGRFTQVVRIYKGIKEDVLKKGNMHKGQINSFYLENLLYNVPDGCFEGSEVEGFYATLEHLSRDFQKRRMGTYCFATGGSLFNKRAWKVEDLGHLLRLMDGV